MCLVCLGFRGFRVWATHCGLRFDFVGVILQGTGAWENHDLKTTDFAVECVDLPVDIADAHLVETDVLAR